MPRDAFYDEVEIEDFKWDPLANVYHYPCPCGDRFEISKSQLRDGDEVARCPSCSLIVRVVYEWDDYEDYDSGEEQEIEEEVTAEEDDADPPSGPITSTPSKHNSPCDAAAGPSNGVPSGLLGKLVIGTKDEIQDSGSKSFPSNTPKGGGDDTKSSQDGTRARDSNEGDLSRTSKGRSNSIGGGQEVTRRSSTPPPRSPKRVEVELE